MTNLKRAKSHLAQPKVIDGFDQPRQLNTGRYTRVEHDHIYQYSFNLPDDAVEVQGNCFWYVTSQTQEAHPVLELTSLSQDVTYEHASWNGAYYHGNGYGVESAPTSWVNDHNVSGKSTQMGYVGGGAGWYLAGGGIINIDFTVSRYGASRISVQWRHRFTRRDASGYPGTFEFSGLILQPMSDLKRMNLNCKGQEYTGVTSYRIL